MKGKKGKVKHTESDRDVDKFQYFVVMLWQLVLISETSSLVLISDTKFKPFNTETRK